MREGGNPRQRHVPDRVTGKDGGMLTEGPHQNVTLDTETLEREFLEAAGWDLETCKPSKQKLESLGLQDVIPMIYAEA